MLVVFAPLIAVTPLWAATPGPQQLLASDDLRATLEIETAPPHYQRAPVVLAVEVATRRWFARSACPAPS